MGSSIAKVRYYLCPSKGCQRTSTCNSFVNHPIPDDWEFFKDLSDKDVIFIEMPRSWKLFFDGATRKDGAGAGVILVTPEEEVLPYAFTFTENCSNNVAEYQALMMGLEMAIELKITRLKMFGDSKLIIKQLLALYKVKKPNLLPYIDHAKKLLEWFDDVSLEHVPRKENRQVDALANLASALTSSDERITVPLCK